LLLGTLKEILLPSKNPNLKQFTPCGSTYFAKDPLQLKRKNLLNLESFISSLNTVKSKNVEKIHLNSRCLYEKKFWKAYFLE